MMMLLKDRPVPFLRRFLNVSLNRKQPTTTTVTLPLSFLHHSTSRILDVFAFPSKFNKSVATTNSDNQNNNYKFKNSIMMRSRTAKPSLFLTIFSCSLMLLISFSWTNKSAATNAMFVVAFVPQQQPSSHHGLIMECRVTSTTTGRSWLNQALLSSTNFFDLPPNNNETLTASIAAAKVQPSSSSLSLRQALELDDYSVDAISLSSFPAVVGHRGCLYDALENTREGFQKCIAMGCDAVELDVFALKCGTLVVFHGTGTDENPGLLDKCLVGNFPLGKSILDYTYKEILQQDWKFKVDHAKFPCPTDSIARGSIPTLTQVLQDVKDASSNMHVTMELKGGYNVPERVLELVDDLNMVHQTSCSSFNMAYLEKVRALRTERDDQGRHIYKTGALFNDILDVNSIFTKAHAVGANEIHLRYDTCTKGLVNEIHRQGFGSMAWFQGPERMEMDSKCKYLDVGNEDESMYQLVLRTGVQRMCVNRPSVLLGLREKLKPPTGMTA